MARRPYDEIEDQPVEVRPVWGPVRTVALLAAVLLAGGAALTGARPALVDARPAGAIAPAVSTVAIDNASELAWHRALLARHTMLQRRNAAIAARRRLAAKKAAAALRARVAVWEAASAHVRAVASARPVVMPFRPPPASPPGGDLSQDPFLKCTRAHESDTSGGYHAVSPSGWYRGAYQFLRSTWNGAAMGAGRPDLVGVDPAAAAPADQDHLALYLYHVRGAAPWGGRCAGLP
jgi:hypothetical protein